MDDPVLKSQVDGAEAYERLMVPALFAEWAPQVARTAAIEPGDTVLDLACGTGVLAREAIRRVGERGRVVGVDPSAGMLAVAAQLAPAVDWRPGAAESLPFEDGSFDRVVSQFGLMFFRDRVAALREVLRVLRPGGRFVAAVWGSLADNPAYAAEVEIVEDIAGERAAEPIRAPYALGDGERLRGLLRETGFEDVEIATVQGSGRFPGVALMVEADLRGWLPLMGVVLSEAEIAAILAQAERRLSGYIREDGGVSFPTCAHIASGRKAR